MKLFDYKFLLTLGLCLIVYFLYREVDILTKRVSVLEKDAGKKESVAPIVDTDKPQDAEKLKESTKSNLLKCILEKAKKSGSKMVEEYSNENHIYSHDNLNTHTHDHDTLMVESILNMVREDLDNNNIAEVSVHFEQITEAENNQPVE